MPASRQPATASPSFSVDRTASERPAAPDIILIHSFSRFFRDHFELEFHTRKLARNGVQMISMTQEVGDDPIQVMIQRVTILFDEYPSRENSKHTLRAMKENARQGWAAVRI